MAKLGYTWYPKDWGNSEAVFQLNLTQRGLYRELIDLAMLNDNKTVINLKVWSRKWDISEDKLKVIIQELKHLNLVEHKGDKLFIPSCEPRLKMVRGGSNGGKKSKPTNKGIVKPISKPTPKGDSNQKKEKGKESKLKVNILEVNSEWRNQFLKHYTINLEEYNKKLSAFSIAYDMERPEKELKQHFFNWFKTQEYKKQEEVVEHWNKDLVINVGKLKNQ